MSGLADMSLSKLQEYHRQAIINAVEKDDYTQMHVYWRMIKNDQKDPGRMLSIYREALRRIDIPPETKEKAKAKLARLEKEARK